MSDDDEDHPADQRPTKSHPGIAEVGGKWIPRIHFLRQKYEFGKFDTQDEAALAYKSTISRVQSVLSGKKPRADPDSWSDDEGEESSGDYFESAEWRIKVLEEDLVRLRKSEASITTRLSLADVRVRCAKEEAKKAQTSSTKANDEIASLKTSGRKLRKERDQAQAELKKVKEQLGAVQKDRDQARKELGKVKEQPQARAAQGGTEQARQLKEVQTQLTAAQIERTQVRVELKKVKEQLGAVQKDRDQARKELGKVKEQLQARAAQGGEEQARQLGQVQAQLTAAQSERNEVRAELGKVKEQLGAVQKERDQARANLAKVKIVLESVSKELSDVKEMRVQNTKTTEVVLKQDGGKQPLKKSLSLDLGVVVCKQTVKEHDAVKMELDACTSLGKRTRDELQDGSDVVRIKRELETAQEKKTKLQLALEIKTCELEKALKRRRTCDCAVEVVDVVD